MTEEQILSLKNLYNQLERYYRKHDVWRSAGKYLLRKYARPNRDRAIMDVLLSTNLRREELVQLDLNQVVTNTPAKLRSAERTTVILIRGKGRTEGTEYLSRDATWLLLIIWRRRLNRRISVIVRVLFKCEGNDSVESGWPIISPDH